MKTLKNEESFYRHCDFQMNMLEYVKEYGYYPSDWFVYQDLLQQYVADAISKEEIDNFVNENYKKYQK